MKTLVCSACCNKRIVSPASASFLRSPRHNKAIRFRTLAVKRRSGWSIFWPSRMLALSSCSVRRPIETSSMPCFLKSRSTFRSGLPISKNWPSGIRDIARWRSSSMRRWFRWAFSIIIRGQRLSVRWSACSNCPAISSRVQALSRQPCSAALSSVTIHAALPCQETTRLKVITRRCLSFCSCCASQVFPLPASPNK